MRTMVTRQKKVSYDEAQYQAVARQEQQIDELKEEICRLIADRKTKNQENDLSRREIVRLESITKQVHQNVKRHESTLP